MILTQGDKCVVVEGQWVVIRRELTERYRSGFTIFSCAFFGCDSSKIDHMSYTAQTAGDRPEPASKAWDRILDDHMFGDNPQTDGSLPGADAIVDQNNVSSIVLGLAAEV